MSATYVQALNRVLSSNGFLGETVVRVKCALVKGSGALSPHKNITAPLYKHIYSIHQCLLAGKNFMPITMGKKFRGGRESGVFGVWGKLPPHSTSGQIAPCHT